MGAFKKLIELLLVLILAFCAYESYWQSSIHLIRNFDLPKDVVLAMVDFPKALLAWQPTLADFCGQVFTGEFAPYQSAGVFALAFLLIYIVSLLIVTQVWSLFRDLPAFFPLK